MSNFSKALRPRREKVFGPAKGLRLDRNAKYRIMAYARGYNARFRQKGRQHWGPLTRATMDVLKVLLFGFHNDQDGRCFPSYEKIAMRANCNRDTVYEAIKALELADVLTWVNRITKEMVKERDLLGELVARWQIMRTSNAYVFRDPMPCAPGRQVYKSENPPGLINQDYISKNPPPRIIVLDPDNDLERALIRLGRATGAIPAM
jgi:hypothetical protein